MVDNLLDGLVSFSEQRRLIAQLSEKSEAELVSLMNNPSLHPGVRSVATHVLNVREASLREADHHGGEQ
jgi:hypothetical protein